MFLVGVDETVQTIDIILVSEILAKIWQLVAAGVAGQCGSELGDSETLEARRQQKILDKEKANHLFKIGATFT